MFPNARDIKIWGDPAGSKRDEIFEVTAFDHLKTQNLNARPTVSNDFKVRREAGAMPMNRLIAGKAGLIVNKRCSACCVASLSFSGTISSVKRWVQGMNGLKMYRSKTTFHTSVMPLGI